MTFRTTSELTILNPAQSPNPVLKGSGSGRNRSVSFKPRVTVLRYFRHHAETDAKKDMWYNEEESMRIQKDIAAIVQSARAQRAYVPKWERFGRTDNGQEEDVNGMESCLRGIEHLLPLDGNINRRDRRANLIKTVLDEQRRQRMQRLRPSRDVGTSLIAALCVEHTKISKQVALMRGISDAASVKRLAGSMMATKAIVTTEYAVAGDAATNKRPFDVTLGTAASFHAKCSPLETHTTIAALLQPTAIKRDTNDHNNKGKEKDAKDNDHGESKERARRASSPSHSSSKGQHFASRPPPSPRFDRWRQQQQQQQQQQKLLKRTIDTYGYDTTKKNGSSSGGSSKCVRTKAEPVL